MRLYYQFTETAAGGGRDELSCDRSEARHGAWQIGKTRETSDDAELVRRDFARHHTSCFFDPHLAPPVEELSDEHPIEFVLTRVQAINQVKPKYSSLRRLWLSLSQGRWMQMAHASDPTSRPMTCAPVRGQDNSNLSRELRSHNN